MKKTEQIIKNMEKYAEENGCDFSKTTTKDLDRTMTDVHFYDWGCLLNFTYDHQTDNVMIIEFSEDSSLDGQIMSEDEFAVFQQNFLDSFDPETAPRASRVPSHTYYLTAEDLTALINGQEISLMNKQNINIIIKKEPEDEMASSDPEVMKKVAERLNLINDTTAFTDDMEEN